MSLMSYFVEGRSNCMVSQMRSWNPAGSQGRPLVRKYIGSNVHTPVGAWIGEALLTWSHGRTCFVGVLSVGCPSPVGDGRLGLWFRFFFSLPSALTMVL